MRHALFAAFCGILLTAFGCAITEYGIITDNDQTTAGKGKVLDINPAPSKNIVNTNGQAHIMKKHLLTGWPDGTDELISFVDQQYDGTATLTTYNNHATDDEPAFHDDLYCNPDWQGCSLFTAPDDNDGNEFDGTFNANCSGARSLSVLWSTGRYYGECGRVAKLGIEDKLSLLGMGALAERFGKQGLLYKWDRSNVTVTLENELGEAYGVPIVGAGELWLSGTDSQAAIDLTHSLLGNTLGWYANWVDRHAGAVTTVTACYNGICADTRIAGRGFVTGGARIRAIRNARF